MTDDISDKFPPRFGNQVPAGTRIGRYTLRRRLGQGGMAEVFLAVQEGPSDFSKVVVVKRMLPHLTENKKYVEMFLREARIAARLNHPNVVQLFELGQDHGTYFLAMEFIDGLTLYRLAKRAWAAGRSLPTEVIVRAVADAALGLHHASTLVDEQGRPAGLVHRDVSPDNLMMTRDGVTKVLDFGIAKTTENRSGVTKTGELKGKIPYMSPEQIQGHPLDGRTDLFSLGVTFYWLLCGRRPFDGPTEVLTLRRVLEEDPLPPSAFNPKVPLSLDRVVLKLLRRDPAQRYANGAALHDRLVGLLGSDGVVRGPAGQLVSEMMAVPDPEDEGTDVTLKAQSSPPSEPISATFAATTITGESFGERKGGALIGITAAALVGFVTLLVLLVFVRPDPEVKLTTVAADAGTAAGADAGAAVDAGALAMIDAALLAEWRALSRCRHPCAKGLVDLAETAPYLEASRDAIEACTDTCVVEKAVVRATPTKTITLRGPSSLTWRADRKTQRGAGKLTVRASVKAAVAVDGRRASSHEVPLVDDVADYDRLPKGRIQFQVVPFARVTVAGKSMDAPATTDELPYGTYTARFVLEGKPPKTRTITLKSAKEVVRVNMNE